MNYINNIDYEVLTPKGFKDFKGIKKTIRYDNIKFIFNDNSSIIVTPEHRFLVRKNIFRRASKLKIGNKILTKKVINIEYNVNCSDNFYDLIEVSDGNIYNTSNVVSHNCGWIESDKYDAFQDSVIPTLATSDNTKIVKISTPNGLNHFYKEVEEAKNNQNGYIYFEVTWRDIDTYTQEWADEEIKRIGITKFNQNYNVKFLGSSSTLLSGQILGELIKKEILVDNFIVNDGKLYEDYNPNYIYAITVDSSKTVGKTEAENDYICVNVLCLRDKIHQVYTYRTNEIHYTELAQIIYDIGEHFDFPLCIVENNEGSGTYTANRLIESLDYPNMYFDPKKDGLEVGIRTTSGNRGIGLTTLKKLIENYKFIVNDSSTIDEFSTFIKVGKRYEAQNGSTDDCIMSLNLLMYVLMDENNDLEITIDDYLQGEIEIKETEESENDVDFVGYIGNGLSSEDKSWLLG